MIAFSSSRFGSPATATFALSALSLFSLLPAAFAQQKQVEREVAFVRALAKEMRFIELAREETDRLRSAHREAANQDRIAQLAIEVSYYGAKARSDRNLQRTLFKEAIDKSKELVESTSDADVQFQARGTLADASQEFGQFLIEELDAARETAPELVKDLEEEAAAVFRAGIESCTKVKEKMDELRVKDKSKEIEFFLMWMRKGVLMREQARAIKRDREVLIERAKGELTDLVLAVGEETAIGLRGLFEIAQCDEVGGNVGDAISFYRDTIEQIGTSLQQAADGELELPGEVQGLLFEMLQEVYLRTGDVMSKQGDPKTGELFTSFRENMTKFGEKGLDLFDIVDARWGHQVMLAEARHQAESGDPQKIQAALAMVQRINDKHPGDSVGVRAKATLRDILAVQSSAVSGKLLFEVAKGEFQKKNYEPALRGLRQAIAAMTAEEQQALGLEAYQMLGTAFGLTDRYLESILALSEGLTRFGKTDEARASDTADTLDRALANHKRQTKTDAAFADLYSRTGDRIAEYSVAGASKLFYKTANSNFTDKNYPGAIAEYEKVTTDFLYYDLARVRIAKAQAALGDFAAARRTLESFGQFTAANSIDPRDSGKSQVRGIATSEAAFIAAQMTYSEARGSEELKLARDPSKYPAALEALRNYASGFGKDAPENLPVVLESIGRLHSDLAELDKAEQAYAELKAKDAPRASRLATEIFTQYLEQLKLRVAELDGAIKENRGDAAIADARKAVTELRRKLVLLGSDYAAGSPKPQLAVLVNTMLGYEALQDWQKVDAIAKQTLNVYGNETAEATKRVIDLTVRPKIGEALLKQERFSEAYEMLVAAEASNPTQWELKRQLSRCLGGWFEVSSAGSGKRVIGLDRADEAYKKYYGEYRQWALRPDVKPFSLDWYRFHWECYWFAKQASGKDGQFKEIAAKFFRIAKATDNFETLRSHGEAGYELYQYFQLNK